MKNLNKMGLGVATLGLLSVGSAQAAVDPAITTALTDAGTDAAVVAGAILLVLIGIKVFSFIQLAMRSK